MLGKHRCINGGVFAPVRMKSYQRTVQQEEEPVPCQKQQSSLSSVQDHLWHHQPIDALRAVVWINEVVLQIAERYELAAVVCECQGA